MAVGSSSVVVVLIDSDLYSNLYIVYFLMNSKIIEIGIQIANKSRVITIGFRDAYMKLWNHMLYINV